MSSPEVSNSDPSSLKGKSVHESELVTYQYTMPADSNPMRRSGGNAGIGNVNGGTILKLVDTYTGMVALRHSRSKVVTASFDRFDFLEPVFVGELVIIKASINRAFTTSMEIGARVEAEDMLTGKRRRVGKAYLTFVALDEHDRPRRVPAVIPETADQKRRYADALARRDLRLKMRPEH